MPGAYSVNDQKWVFGMLASVRNSSHQPTSVSLHQTSSLKSTSSQKQQQTRICFYWMPTHTLISDDVQAFVYYVQERKPPKMLRHVRIHVRSSISTPINLPGFLASYSRFFLLWFFVVVLSAFCARTPVRSIKLLNELVASFINAVFRSLLLATIFMYHCKGTISSKVLVRFWSFTEREAPPYGEIH